MLEQLVETGEKICAEFEENKKGKKLERTTWVATSLLYVESKGSHSVIHDVLFDLDLLERPLNMEDAILLTALLKAELAIENLKKPASTCCVPKISGK